MGIQRTKDTKTINGENTKTNKRKTNKSTKTPRPTEKKTPRPTKHKAPKTPRPTKPKKEKTPRPIRDTKPPKKTKRPTSETYLRDTTTTQKPTGWGQVKPEEIEEFSVNSDRIINDFEPATIGYRAYIEIIGLLSVGIVVIMCCHSMCSQKSKDEKYQLINEPVV